MRNGWADKELAIALRVAEHKASQSYMPALRKVARLLSLDAARTMRDLAWACESLGPMTAEEVRLLRLMFDDREQAELELLERMHEGRADREEIGQTSRSTSSVPTRPCTVPLSPGRGSCPPARPARCCSEDRDAIETT